MESVTRASAPTSSPPFDVERHRAEFPILGTRVADRPLVYLDNAVSTQKPRAVIDAVRLFYETSYGNVHRGVYKLSQAASAAYEGVRTKVQRFINARESREIVYTRGTTEAINLVAQSFVRPRLNAGDEILLTQMEHHSNIVPWQLLRTATGAVLRVAPITDAGELDVAGLAQRLGPRTKFVAVAHTSNALGTINPVAEICRLAHARGIPVLVDGAQAVPHGPVDVQALGADFFAFSGHKMYGPSGIGVLYGRHEWLETMPPYQGGGDMILSVSFEQTSFNQIPFRFEAGTPNIEGTVGLGAAIDYLESVGMEAIARHEQTLLRYATAALERIPQVRIIGTAQHKAAVVSFTVAGVHPHDVGTVLDAEGVAVRAGHHCAQPVMERMGVPATVRASFGLYNTVADVDALVRAIHRVLEIFG